MVTATRIDAPLQQPTSILDCSGLIARSFHLCLYRLLIYIIQVLKEIKMRLGVFIYILHRFYTCKAASYAKYIHDHPTSSSFVILKVVKLKYGPAREAIN